MSEEQRIREEVGRLEAIGVTAQSSSETIYMRDCDLLLDEIDRLKSQYTFAVDQCVIFTEKLYKAKLLDKVFLIRWQNEQRNG